MRPCDGLGDSDMVELGDADTVSESVDSCAAMAYWNGLVMMTICWFTWS